jgi:predicted amidohydrolase YtcJ
MHSNCFAVGLTTVEDCGLPYTMVSTIASLQHKGALKMRMYVMLSDSPENFEYLFKRGVYKTPGLDVRSFKMYADGALGSRRGLPAAALFSDQKTGMDFY